MNSDICPSDVGSENLLYEALVTRVVEASGYNAKSILQLGIGTGKTAGRLIERHRTCSLIGIDPNRETLVRIAQTLPIERVQMIEQRLQDPLPSGPFDLVVSTLAIHSLQDPEKATLFNRVAHVMGTWSRFVLGDIIVSGDVRHDVMELDRDYEFPSTIAEQVSWLRDAKLWSRVLWKKDNLAVLVAHLM